MYEYFACFYVCAPCTCLLPGEVRRRHQILQNWIYRWLWGVVWVLGLEPASSTRAASPLNCRASSPAPCFDVLKEPASYLLGCDRRAQVLGSCFKARAGGAFPGLGMCWRFPPYLGLSHPGAAWLTRWLPCLLGAPLFILHITVICQWGRSSNIFFSLSLWLICQHPIYRTWSRMPCWASFKYFLQISAQIGAVNIPDTNVSWKRDKAPPLSGRFCRLQADWACVCACVCVFMGF